MAVKVSVQNGVSHCLAEVGCHGHTMPRITERIIQAICFAHMRHHIEREVQRSAPGVFHHGVLQLRKDLDHLAPQDRRAETHSGSGLREKSRPTAEYHASVPQSEVMQKMFGVEDHPVAWNDFL